MEGVKEGVYSLKAIAYEETELKQKRAHVKLVKEQIIASFFLFLLRHIHKGVN